MSWDEYSNKMSPYWKRKALDLCCPIKPSAVTGTNVVATHSHECLWALQKGLMWLTDKLTNFNQFKLNSHMRIVVKTQLQRTPQLCFIHTHLWPPLWAWGASEALGVVMCVLQDDISSWTISLLPSNKNFTRSKCVKICPELLTRGEGWTY